MWDILVRLFAGLAMIGLAIGLAFSVRRLYPSWRPYRWGALCFVLSQVAHVPFNAIVLSPFFRSSGWDLVNANGGIVLLMSLTLGLSAGLFEETARWIFYQTKFRHEAPSFEFALMFGAGHGGCEAIIIGWLAIMALVGMTYLRAHSEAIPSDQEDAIRNGVTEYWASSLLVVLMAPVERIIAMTFHLCASVLVWQSVVQKNHWYYVAAVAFHTILDAVAVFLMITYGPYAVELCLLLTAFPLSIYILWYYYQASKETSTPPPDDLMRASFASESHPNDEEMDTAADAA